MLKQSSKAVKNMCDQYPHPPSDDVSNIPVDHLPEEKLIGSNISACNIDLASTQFSQTSTTGSVLTKSEKILNIQEIESKMSTHGFPEMRLLWSHFKKQTNPTLDINETELAEHRTSHMDPYFGKPMTTITALSAISSAAGVFFHSLVSSTSNNTLYNFALSEVAAIGVYFLGTLALTALQRKVAFPMMKIMAEDLAFMLSKNDFRRFFENTESTIKTKKRLSKLGINDTWDNPQHITQYNSQGKEIEIKDTDNLTLATLRDFLGYLNPKTRKFQSGKYLSHMKNGKKSVTEFIAAHKNKIELSKQGLLPQQEGIKLLTKLKDSYLKDSSRGEKIIANVLHSIQSGKEIKGKSVQVEIWKRDPWTDLTHQEEFFSSASLRGVKMMGRGTKGRLGTFGYLRNKSISALDFSNKKGRAVRVRMAATVNKKSGKAILYIDGVEGSNTIKPFIIKKGIEDYAKSTGFEIILYNKYAHNRTPKNFIAHLEKEDIPVRHISIEYVDHSTREYLDGMGWPIEPFEYKIPRGSISGHVQILDQYDVNNFQKETTLRKTYNLIRQNSLWIIAGNSTLFATIVMATSAPWAIIPFTASILTLGHLHLKYQKKSEVFT